VNTAVRSINPETAVKLTLKHEDILVNKSSGSPRLVGWPSIFEDPADGRDYLFSNFMLRLRSRDAIEPRYLLYYLHSASVRSIYLEGQATTSGLRNLKVKAFLELPVVLPYLDNATRSLEMQRRIVARIEELLAEVKKARALLAEMRRDTGRMMEAVLNQAFGELEEYGVEYKPLESALHAKPQYGTSQKASETPPGIPVLRMGNIVGGKVSFDNLKYVSLSPAEEEKYRLRYGDVLFNRTNSAELVGKSAVFEEVEPAVFASYLIRFSPDPAVANPHYVTAYINSGRGREYIRSQLTRAIGQVNVNAKKLAAMPIPLPDAAVQKRIVAHLGSVQAEVDRMREALDEEERLIERLERSILERAFRGEL
jgi:type I restriction enzyme, S subunit